VPQESPVLAGVGAHQRRLRLVLQARADLPQRHLAVVEDQVVDEVEDAGIRERSQGRRREAATERPAGVRARPREPVADEQRREEHAGEGAAQAHEVGVLGDLVRGELEDHGLDLVAGPGQLAGDPVEADVGAEQALRVFVEREVRADGLLEELDEVEDRQRRTGDG